MVCRETWGRPESSNASSDAVRWLEERCPRATAVAVCVTDGVTDYSYPGDERRSTATERARRRCHGRFEALALASCDARLREYFGAMRTIELDAVDTHVEDDGRIVAVARGRQIDERPPLERPGASTELQYLRRRAVDWELEGLSEREGQLEIRCVHYPGAGD